MTRGAQQARPGGSVDEPAAASAPSAPSARAVVRSLIVAPQWIGDAVMSEPLLAALAARGEVLTVAALPWVAPVYRAMPQVAEVLEWPFAHGRLDLGRRWRIASLLRGRFDAAYVLPNSVKSALVPWLAGIARRIGYAGEGRALLLNERKPNPPGRPPMVAFYRALAGPRHGRAARPGVGPELDAHPGLAPDLRPRLHVDAERLRAVTHEAGVQPGRYWVFAPGAEYGPAKRWPADHFAALAKALHADGGEPVLLLGAAGEAALCEQIAAWAPGACRVLAGSLLLSDAIALIAAARGMVSNDSGLMHVAAAFGVPQAALFGSTSPEHTPPMNPNARVVWLKEELQLDCAPCFDRVCRFGHTRCLTGIAAPRIEALLREAVGAAIDADRAAATAAFRA